jgi:hypothetical protein
MLQAACGAEASRRNGVPPRCKRLDEVTEVLQDAPGSARPRPLTDRKSSADRYIGKDLAS